MTDLPNGKKCPKLPENESFLPERVKRSAKEREAFVKAMEDKRNLYTSRQRVKERGLCLHITPHPLSQFKSMINQVHL